MYGVIYSMYYWIMITYRIWMLWRFSIHIFRARLSENTEKRWCLLWSEYKGGYLIITHSQQIFSIYIVMTWCNNDRNLQKKYIHSVINRLIKTLKPYKCLWDKRVGVWLLCLHNMRVSYCTDITWCKKRVIYLKYIFIVKLVRNTDSLNQSCLVLYIFIFIGYCHH